MAQLNNLIRYYAVYLNRVAYMGEACDVKLPDLKIKMEEFRGGGMDIPVEVDLGMDKLEAEFRLYAYNPEIFHLFGRLGNEQVAPLTFRGHFQGQATNPQVARVLLNMDVRVKDLSFENWKPGSKSEVTVKCAVDFYEYFHNDTRLIRIDPMNFHREINGIDQLNEARISLGLTASSTN